MELNEKQGDAHPAPIQLNELQRKLLTVGSGLVCLLNPSRGNMIATFGELSASRSLLGDLRQQMLCDSVGRTILEEKPVFNSKTISLPGLAKLPTYTFGYHYHSFISYYGYSPDDRRPVQFIDEPELAYVMLRYRQIHDLTHVLLGMPTNLLGEITVKKFEAMQLHLPLCVLGSTFATLRLGPVHYSRYLRIALPWIIRNAKRCRKSLLNVYFEKELVKPIDELRFQLNLIPPPKEVRGKWVPDQA